MKNQLLSRFSSAAPLVLAAGLALLCMFAILFRPQPVKGSLAVEEPAAPASINPDWKHQGITWRVSVSSAGVEGNGYVGSDTAITPDGRYVAFTAASDNLVAGDTHYGFEDAFVHDNQTGLTERVSVSSSGVPGDQDTYYGIDLSADGRYVVFCSKASTLVGGDTNGKWDIFVRDRTLGTTTLISKPSPGVQSNGDSWAPRISADGSTVVYLSKAANLVTGDSNGRVDFFAYNLVSGLTERVSVTSSETQAQGDDADNKPPAVSADGRFVAFTSAAADLVENDTNAFCDYNGDGFFTENCEDIFLRDRTLGTTTRISVDAGGGQANNMSILPAISADGRYVAFYSFASNLVEGDTNTCLSLYYSSGPCPDVFVKDTQSGAVERVNVSSGGAQSTVDPVNYFKPPAISGDGNIVVFASSDTTLAPGATNGKPQVLAHDRTTHQTSLVSANTYGHTGDFNSHCSCDLSSDGRYVSFYSLAGNLVYDGNSLPDIFVRDRTGWTYALDGTVVTGEGVPLADVRAGYGDKTGEWKDTDTNGEYQLYYMKSGTYTVHAFKAGWISDPAERLVSVPPTTLGVNFVMRPAAAVVYLPVIRR